MHIEKQVSLNLNVRGMEQSATIAINDHSAQLQRQGQTVYRLGLGQSPFPVPDVVVEALRANAHEKAYLPAAGLPELRSAVAEYHRRKDGVDVSESNVLIGPGSKELMFLIQLSYYGELVLPTPCWVSYTPQARIIGRKITLIHTNSSDRWRMTAELLEKNCERQRDKLRPRILILNYPGNPEGCSYSAEELQALAEVARQYQIILLSDEIYGPLHHEGRHISIARYYPEGTIISSGISKWCGAGGWRLGTFTFPRELDWLMHAMTSVASETYTSVCAPIQHAAVRAFQGGEHIENYLQHARRILKALGNEISDRFNESGIQVHSPTGAFYLFLDFSKYAEQLKRHGVTTSADLTAKLLNDTGVAILPGQSFERPENELTARLAYVDFDGAKALSASHQVGLDSELPADFTELYCYNVVKASHMISDWVKSL